MEQTFNQPFISSALNVIATMSSLPVAVGESRMGVAGAKFGCITGIIGMSSAELSGNMLIRFEEAAILQIVNTMLREQFTHVNKDIIDAVGEITNMVVGGAKMELAKLGHIFDMASPAVVEGNQVHMVQSAPDSALLLPFSVPQGKFMIEAVFVKKARCN